MTCQDVFGHTSNILTIYLNLANILALNQPGIFSDDLSGIPSSLLSDTSSGIIMSDTYSDILSSNLSGIQSGINSDILCVTLSGQHFDILSRTLSGIQSGIFSHSLGNIKLHSIWHSI